MKQKTKNNSQQTKSEFIVEAGAQNETGYSNKTADTNIQKTKEEILKEEIEVCQKNIKALEEYPAIKRKSNYLWVVGDEIDKLGKLQAQLLGYQQGKSDERKRVSDKFRDLKDFIWGVMGSDMDKREKILMEVERVEQQINKEETGK